VNFPDRMLRGLVVAAAIIGLLLAGFVVLAACVKKAGPGEVGIKVNLAGDKRGVDQIPIQTGWIFYNPLTQTVFVKALEALPRYESRGVPFGGWLFRLARNTVIDHVRTRHDHSGLDTLVERATGEQGPDEQTVTRHEIEAMSRALGALTDEQRDVIALRFFAGLSAREAAAAMGKQEGTIRGLQFRAIAALRRELGLEESGPTDRTAGLGRRQG
jgi:RNA polymerase sigma-70 factor (ECF subfamily)